MVDGLEIQEEIGTGAGIEIGMQIETETGAGTENETGSEGGEIGAGTEIGARAEIGAGSEGVEIGAGTEVEMEETEAGTKIWTDPRMGTEREPEAKTEAKTEPKTRAKARNLRSRSKKAKNNQPKKPALHAHPEQKES